MLSGILSDNLSDILSDVSSDISPDILSDTNLLAFFLAVEVWQGTLSADGRG